MRVITGTARGKKLQSPKGDQVRPTADRVKEAVFSALQFDLPGAAFLDLFAGSGQMGIEALSRGAARAVFIDQSRESCALVIDNLKATGLFASAQVSALPALQYLATAKEKFDLIYVDPPYDLPGLDEVLLRCGDVAAPGAILMVETARSRDLPERAGDFTRQKTYRYGKTAITQYRLGE